MSSVLNFHKTELRFSNNKKLISIIFFSKYFNRDFVVQLNEKEKTLNGKHQLEIERCAVITRLRRYLEEVGLVEYLSLVT